jgi:PilZ domain
LVSEDFQRKRPDAGARFAERRSAPRYALVAQGEIIDPILNTRLSGRTAEIGLGGCYVDTLNPLPQGTVIRVSIQRDGGTFVTSGRVAYTHEGIGMGVQFLDIQPEQSTLLRKWIDELLSSSEWTRL